jgi:hypothetical protein
MTWIRKVTLTLLLTAAVAVIVVSVVELWNYRQWDYLPLHSPHATELDQRARALEDRVEILTRRVGDVELLVFVLLGTSGLYAIVFVVTSYFSAMGFARQADRAIAHIQDQIGIALGDLRELQEETQQKLEEGPALNAAKLEEFRAEAQAMIQEQLTAHTRSFARSFGNPEAQLTAMLEKTSAWNPENMDDQAKLELLHYEDAAACLEMAGAQELQPAIANLYRSFAKLYASPDKIRTRFYLTRALKLVAPDSPLASELHYDLACCFAGNRDFQQALRELTAAFQHQSRALDDRLAKDIDDGGKLDELASTAPFDKALNDLLLNVSVP